MKKTFVGVKVLIALGNDLPTEITSKTDVEGVGLSQNRYIPIQKKAHLMSKQEGKIGFKQDSLESRFETLQSSESRRP